MPTLTSFSALREAALELPSRVRVAVCRPSDEHTLRAVLDAVALGFVHAILTGEVHPSFFESRYDALRPHIEHHPAPDADTAVRLAVQWVREGRADVLMKGMVNTDDLLRHILHRDYGLRTAGAVVSHAAVFEIPRLSRLLIVSDVSVIPYPTLEQRAAQLRYTTAIARSLGIAEPRVALLHCTEKISEKFPVTADYVVLRERAAAGEWGAVRVDGPFDLLCAVLPEALAQKGLHSSLEGRADILLMPDIQAGNVLYKSLHYFAEGSTSASLLCGTIRPVVLTSRGDDIATKINSLALAALQVRSAGG